MSDNLDMAQIAKAVEGVNRGFEEFKAANDARLREIEGKGADPLTVEKLARIDAELDRLQDVADQAVLAAKRRERFATDKDGKEIDLDAKAGDWAKMVAAETKADVSSFASQQMQDYRGAFMRLVRKNFQAELLREEDRKALSVGVDSAGGYFVYPDLSGATVRKIYETSAVRAYASVTTIGTDRHVGYYDNDEVGSGWVAEMESRAETTTPSIGRWEIPVHEMYAMPAASQTVLDDSLMDMEAWLSMKIADKFARAENSAFVTGNGVDKPRGFLDYPDGTDLTNSIERFNTGVNGGFAAAPNGGDVLLDALYGLKQQYRGNATWFMNRATMKAVRKLKDTDGSYLWTPGIAAGQPATLLAYPVASFEDMPDIATGSLSIAVGDLRSAYQIVDRMGIRMLRDPYSSKPKVLFYATKRTGGDVTNGEALKIIEFSA